MSLTLQPDAEPVVGYRLLRQLGSGGFGEVWEAAAPGEFPVALKFVRLDGAQSVPELRALQILRAVRHPHLLDVQWVTIVPGWLIIAMPRCDRSLLDRHTECARQGLPGIPRAELLRYLGEAANALDFLNEPRHRLSGGEPVGVQHRDVKPHNLLLVGDSVRVADFGLAKVLESTAGYHSGPMTLRYAPPEFFQQRFAANSDQYSLAATYCQLRGGRLPFGGTLERLVYAILHEEPDLSSLPEPERPAVARALAKRSEDRWPSCRAFVEALHGLAPDMRPRTAALQALAVEVRLKTLQLLSAAKDIELTWRPVGTSNHLLWHAGHALWVQDALCVQIITGRSELPPGSANQFGMGSRPAQQREPWPSRDELHRHLTAQLPRLTELIGGLRDADLDLLPPFAHAGDRRSLGECVLHGLHDEANHQGEMYLLLKMQRLGPREAR